MRKTLRSDEMLSKYKAHLSVVGIGTTDIRDLNLVKLYNFWKLVSNEFPYDKIASQHDMLVPIRDLTDDSEMFGYERDELFIIKDEFAKNRLYDCIIENVKHNRTVPNQYHLHCIKFKEGS